MFFRTARLAVVRFARTFGLPRADFNNYPQLGGAWLYTVFVGKALTPRVALMVIWVAEYNTFKVNVFGRWSTYL